MRVTLSCAVSYAGVTAVAFVEKGFNVLYLRNLHYLKTVRIGDSSIISKIKSSVILVASAILIFPACMFDAGGIPMGNEIEDGGQRRDGEIVEDGGVGNDVYEEGEGGVVDSVCGNGVVEEGEDCENNDLNGKTCSDFAGLQAGVLTCGEDCRFDFSSCTGCGNGILENEEECDGSDFGGATCETLGFDGGDLSCNVGCRFVKTGCYKCGDDVREGPEQCDGSDLGGMSCVDLEGFHSGTLSCSEGCLFNTNECAECGDGDCHASEEGGVCKQDCSDPIFEEDFGSGGNWPGDWDFWDADDGSGETYWGRDDGKSRSGSYSLWCAKGGDGPDEDLLGNLSYRNDMHAYAIYPLDLSGVSGNVMVSFWVWCKVAGGNDWFKFIHSGDGGDTYQGSGEYGGSGSWEYMEFDVSQHAGNADFVFGFLFNSNGIGSWELGAYVDDVRVVEWW